MPGGGERPFLGPLLQHFGDTPPAKIDHGAVSNAAVTLYSDASPATVYTPVSAVLHRTGTGRSRPTPSGHVLTIYAERTYPHERQ